MNGLRDARGKYGTRFEQYTHRTMRLSLNTEKLTLLPSSETAWPCILVLQAKPTPQRSPAVPTQEWVRRDRALIKIVSGLDCTTLTPV